MRKLLLITLLFLFALTGYCQNSNTVRADVPHLPTFIRFDGGAGKMFEGDKYYYNVETNLQELFNWIKNYPLELAHYKISINNYLQITDSNQLSNTELEIYHDLKSQWLFIVKNNL